MKEQLTRPGISAGERQRMLLALKQYIGIMIWRLFCPWRKKGFPFRTAIWNSDFLPGERERGRHHPDDAGCHPGRAGVCQ